MKQRRLSLVIHLFALAHAFVCALCAIAAVPDATLLTLMTMMMTVVLCMNHRLRVGYTALAILLANVAGFLLGTLGAILLDPLFPDPEWVPHSISTFLTTEIIGWGLHKGASRLPLRMRTGSHSRIGLLIVAIVGIMLFRLSLNLLSEGYIFKGFDFTASIVTEVTALVLVLVFSGILYGVAMKEREKSHRADLRYMTLKNLVNPHFLFNSLNILDGLVEPDNQAAKDYIRRLASLYRYMTVHEGESLVQLSDERLFAKNYMELMRVRFPGAIVTSVTVREQELNTRIVPCSIQILLENAVKHNAFSPERPLRITITTESGWFIVSNNIQQRTTPAASTGIGIHYIQSRYRDICNREIEILNDGKEFTVRVPLIP